MDVKYAFLNDVLEEEVQVEQLLGFMKRGKENEVYKLNKALYGLQQTPRAQYICINSYFLENDFHKYPYKHNLYIKTTSNGDVIIIYLYVDDLISSGNNLRLMMKFKEAMIVQFKMKNMGLMSLLSWY